MKATPITGAGAPDMARPEAIAGTAVAAFLALSAMNLLSILILYGGLRGKRLAWMFYFDTEANFATLFNFLLLVGVAVLLALNAVRAYAAGDRWRHHWAGLSALLLLMAFDEAAQMHERLNGLMRRLVELDGFLRFAWVIPGAIFAVVVGLAFLRFVLALPRSVAVLTVVAGGMYVAGALGIELVGAKLWSPEAQTLQYALVASLEESLEMLALILFGYAMMLPLADRDGRLCLPLRG
jgi:hypothetical protein